MKCINLCGKPKGGCCPSIKDDFENDIMYIVDGNQRIGFNKTERKNLKKYLEQRDSND